MKLNKLFFITLSSLLLSFIASGQSLEDQAKQLGISQSTINSYKNNTQKIETSPATISSDNRDRSYRDTTSVKPKIDVVSNIKNEPKTTRFGSEIFNNKNLSFEPNFNIATPSDYKLAAGDEVLIDVWGASEQSYKLTISPEGTITIPKIGVISIASLTIEQAEIKILSALSSIYSGMDDEKIEMSLSLGNMRSVKVNVVGEAKYPGSYTLPSLSTLFNVIYLAGGVNNIGSLREIKLFRDGKLITTLDIYDYILNGNNSSNIRLEDNDMVLIEPYKNLIATEGALKRERIYELKDGENIEDLLKYSGGFRGDAFTDKISVSRKNGDRYQINTVVEDNYSLFQLQDGDLVEVEKSLPIFENRVTINGAVWREGNYEIRPTISTLKELVSQAGGLKGDAFTNRVQISRMQPDFSYNMISIDLKKLLKGEVADIELKANDKIYIPSHFDITEKKSIKVYGEVNYPKSEDKNRTEGGKFDFFTKDSYYVDREIDHSIYFTDGMTIEDAILLAGGMKESASESLVIVSRRIKDPTATQSENETTKEFSFPISKDLSISEEASNFKLEPFDEITIRKSPTYYEQRGVVINGEVEFPGRYVLTTRNQRLSEIINKAGGFNQTAYVKGARLVRKKSSEEINREMAKLEIRGSIDSTNTANVEPHYNVGIDVEKAMMFPGSNYDPVMREDDIIIIPELTNTVKISGGVLHENNVSFLDGKNFKHYIKNAGGYVPRASRKAYIVYMNGTVAMAKGAKIEPGCEIIVPMKADRKNALGVQGWVGLASSITSVAAMTTTMINNF